MNKKVISIHQPNYIPWLGYFHKINNSDVFVILDDVQYVKGTVANRNKILASSGKEQLLTVPVMISKGSGQKFNEIEVNYREKWQNKHLLTIKNNYRKSKYFDKYFPKLEAIIKAKYESLGALNIALIYWLLEELKITTEIKLSSDIHQDKGGSNVQNIFLVKEYDGDIYLSGTGANKYNDITLFDENSIELKYQVYQPVKYHQLYVDSFVENLSVLDALFNIGPEVRKLFDGQ
jgi:hypothetical protein